MRSAAASLICTGRYAASATDAADAPDAGIEILNPRGRVPLSFIIDDSTCLVNMGHFCMPQFAEAWPERDTYKQPWRDWPREIPDAFVREFGQWCAQHGVKGKYSIVPFPACVGWMDRTLPGWSRKELDDSLKLVRDLMVPNWDIHPEMITHTRIIDLKTGRPMPDANASTMENSYPQTDISVDHLAAYLAYALRILKNCDLPCEGITTPGGFGNRVKDKLPVAVRQAVQDVYGVELPHYFKYVRSGQERCLPVAEYDGEKTFSNLTMNVPAGTGDWFGGWEGSKSPQPDLYCTKDAAAGRMVDLILRGEPAVMLCHWPGMYCNGSKTGFRAFQRVVTSIASRFGDETMWMKVSEIGRYWAAKEWVRIERTQDSITFDSPLTCRDFTLRISQARLARTATMHTSGKTIALREVAAIKSLAGDTILVDDNDLVVCIDLPKGTSRLQL